MVRFAKSAAHLAGMTEGGLATRERPSPPANRSGVNSPFRLGCRTGVAERERMSDGLTGELLASDGLHDCECARV